MPQDASHTSFLWNLNTEPQAPHGKQNKALGPYSQGKRASDQVAGGARSLSHLVCCAISETHSVAGELPKVSTICKSINRAESALEREVKEGVGRVEGNAMCLQIIGGRSWR